MITNSVIKAFRIVECLSTQGEARISDIATSLDMDKATVYRLLSTMKEIGYISQNIAMQRYSLSPKFIGLTGPTPGHQNLIEMAHPYLKRLTDLTDETACLALLSGSNVIYVDFIDSKHTINATVTIGSQYPAHTVATGKAMLAYMPVKQIEDSYKDKELVALTPNSVKTLPVLLDDLTKVRERGYAIDNEECSKGLFCLAAPVLDVSGYPVAGISIGFPLYRHSNMDDQKKMAKHVCQIAGQVSEALGCSERSLKNIALRRDVR